MYRDVSVFYFVAPNPDPYNAWEGDFFRDVTEAVKVRDKINELATRKPYKIYVATMLVKDEVGKPEPVQPQQLVNNVDSTSSYQVDAPMSLASVNGVLKRTSAARPYHRGSYTRSVRMRDGTVAETPVPSPIVPQVPVVQEATA